MAGKSLTPFYVGLGVLAIAGAAFIVRSSGSRQPPLTAETTAPLVAGPRGVTMGSDSAPVEVMEFADFECPWCGQFAQVQMPDVRQRLVNTGKVRWRFVNYPLSGHTKSPYAHLAAACANEQGRFWEMAELIYANQEDWVSSSDPLKRLAEYATRAGIDRARYDSCVKERRAWGRVVADKALGDSLGVGGSGTPTFFIDGRQWPGRSSPTVDQLLAVADSLAARKAGAAAPAGARRPAGR
jgi:protein-disulfide isomerase